MAEGRAQVLLVHPHVEGVPAHGLGQGQLRAERSAHLRTGVPRLVPQLAVAPDDHVLQLGGHLRRRVVAADVDLHLHVTLVVVGDVEEVARQGVDGARVAQHLGVQAHHVGDHVAHRPGRAGCATVPLCFHKRLYQLGYRLDGVSPGVGVGLEGGMQTHGTGPLGGRYTGRLWRRCLWEVAAVGGRLGSPALGCARAGRDPQVTLLCGTPAVLSCDDRRPVWTARMPGRW